MKSNFAFGMYPNVAENIYMSENGEETIAEAIAELRANGGNGGSSVTGDKYFVAGTMERKALLVTNLINKVGFEATDGDIASVNEQGEWICPEDGLYFLSVGLGTFPNINSIMWSLFVLNSPNAVNYSTCIGVASAKDISLSPQNNAVSLLKKGDNISFWINVSSAQAKTSNPSNFSIIRLA